jgi:protein-tyrosine phosphatase
VIDLHCHVLPGIDDGAADLEDSLGMARQAEADGIEVICATPHIRHDHDVQVHELPVRSEALTRELRSRGVSVEVRPGGEVAETALGGLSDEELRTVSLCGTGHWVLLEPAPGPLSESLTAAVEELRERGARSVIAHPERHVSGDTVERLQDLVGRGALVQVTAAYLEDDATAPGLLDLAARGLVHLLGSDAHSSRAGRPVALSGGFARLGELPLLRTQLEWVMSEAPAAILRGDDVLPPY